MYIFHTKANFFFYFGPISAIGPSGRPYLPPPKNRYIHQNIGYYQIYRIQIMQGRICSYHQIQSFFPKEYKQSIITSATTFEWTCGVVSTIPTITKFLQNAPCIFKK